MNNKIITPLHRRGNKTRIFDELYLQFPQRSVKTFIEPFAGSLSVSLNVMERNKNIKYFIANDLDKEIFNFWMVLKNNLEEFEKKLYLTPTHAGIFDYYKNNIPDCLVERAVRFIILSNFGYLGGSTFRLGRENTKEMIVKKLDFIIKPLQKITFDCKNYEEFIFSISDRELKETKKTFCYCDVPYFAKDKSSYQAKFNIKDFRRLIYILKERGWLFAISESDDARILDIAKKAGLNVRFVCERQNIKNRMNEILLTNY